MSLIKFLRLQGDDMSAPYDEKILFRLHLALWANSLHTQFSFLTTVSKNVAVRISIK